MAKPQKYRMKDLTYGWKRMTGEEFSDLPSRQRKNAIVVFFSRGLYPKSWDGMARSVIHTHKHLSYVSLPEDPEDPRLFMEYSFIVFMKVPSKIGRFIP